MLGKLITASTNYLIRRQVIDEENRDIYEYGFHALYNNIIDIASIIVISILLGQVMQTVLYHLSFAVIRRTAGGYHAKTHLRCFVMSTVIWLLSLWGIAETSSQGIYIILALLSTIVVWTKSPIEHENSPMNADKYNRMKMMSRILSTIFLGVIILWCVIMGNAYIWIPAALAYGMISHSLLMLISLWEKSF